MKRVQKTRWTLEDIPHVVSALHATLQKNPTQEEWLHGHVKKVILPNGKKILARIDRTGNFEPAKKPEKGADTVWSVSADLGFIVTVDRSATIPLGWRPENLPVVSVFFPTSEPKRENERPRAQLIHMDSGQLAKILKENGYTHRTEQSPMAQSRLISTPNGREPFRKIALRVTDHYIYHNGNRDENMIGYVTEKQVGNRPPEVESLTLYLDHLSLLNKLLGIDKKTLPQHKA